MNFHEIAPSNKIPAIIDRENGQSIFESGAIMIYLAKNIISFYHKSTIGK